MPGYADAIKEWTEAQGTGTPANKMLRWALGQAPAPEVLSDIHRLSLGFLKDGEQGVKPITDRFATTAHLCVDLHANDDVLTRWFKAWLRKERMLLDEAGVKWRRPPQRSRTGKAKYSKNDGERWAKLRVLDYIDFKIAAMVSGEKMPTHERIAGFLFPNQDGDSRLRVRQEVLKLEKKLMSQSVLDALHSQAVAEDVLSRQVL